MNIISPKEIRKTDFKKSFRGYDSNEVDAFLEALSLRFERLVEENTEMSSKLATLATDLEVYRENEATLQKAIVKMQDVAENVIENAKKKAANIEKEAQLNAQRLAQEADKEILGRKSELEELKLRNDRIVEDMKLFFMEKLNEMEEFVKSRNVYKMELARPSYDSYTGEEETEKQQVMKKISINTSGSGSSD